MESVSKREYEVMRLLTQGMALKEIGTELGISVQTAPKHRSRLFEKLDVHTEVELLKLLIRVYLSLALNE